MPRMPSAPTARIFEKHRGTVIGAGEGWVRVRYGAPSHLDQVYAAKQFEHGRLPREGDTVSVEVCILFHAPRRLRRERLSRLPSFSGRAAKGPIRL
jgi:hypothetical protein